MKIIKKYAHFVEYFISLTFVGMIEQRSNILINDNSFNRLRCKVCHKSLYLIHIFESNIVLFQEILYVSFKPQSSHRKFHLPPYLVHAL